MIQRQKYNLAITATLLNLISIVSNAQSPSAAFNTDLAAGCSPLTIQFTNKSLNASSYYWDFGNGNISVLTNPSNVYSTTGTFTVKLISISADGQKDSVVSADLITVSANSISDFYATSTISCLDGNNFSFVNTSLNSTTFLWDFGDGTTSTLQNPTHSYSSEENYTVKLIAYNSFGCADLKTMPNYIQVIPKPGATFTVNTTTACTLNQVFDFTSATPSTNSWLWNFGDGVTSTLPNPHHTYSSEGTYSVSLVAGNANGCTDSIVKNNYISIYINQIPSFTADTTIGCSQLPITFTNTSAGSDSWLWDFGDNETSTQQNPSHTYQNSGNYTVSLKITTSNNCSYTTSLTNYINIQSNAVSNFSLINNNGCAPLNVQFTNLSTNDVSRLWDFGDGTNSTLANPLHSYTTNGTYTVKLYSYNFSGCESVFQNINAVTLKPTLANFSANLNSGCVPLTTNFSNSSLNASQWFWDFGDGSTSTLENPSHIYNFPGDYDVRLVASTPQGCSDTLSINSYIHVISAIANYTPPPALTGCIPLDIPFNSPANEAVSWLWNFGDGATSALQNPSHTFITAGMYTVSLTIQLNTGCTQVYPNFRTFNVQGGQAEFTTTQTQCKPYIVNFMDTTSGNWVNRYWDFGDGSTDTLQNPIHTYSNPGFYTIMYSAISSAGCTGKIIQSNLIHFVACSTADSAGAGAGGSGGGSGDDGAGNQPGDAPPPLKGCIPLMVNYHNTIPGAISWLWNFGDGNTSILENPTHNYITDGNYDVTLITHDSAGASDTLIYTNYIQVSGITPTFSFTQNNNCENPTLTFIDSSQNVTSWSWDFGDGAVSALQNPTHTYSDSLNNYTITLTTFNNQGCSGSMSKNVLTGFDNIVVSATNYIVCGNQPVDFSCSSSNFSAYLWDFGDGTTSLFQNPAHSYLIAGTFHVSVIVTNYNGCTHNFLMQNPITVQNPVADFNYAPTNLCNSQIVNFTNFSTGTSLPLASHCKWDFGDGSPVQWEENPIHTFINPGTYQVTLTVDYDSSCFKSVTKTISINPTLIADFLSTQNTTCFPITVTYNNLIPTAISWLWDFGDGTTSTLQNPIHTFTEIPSDDVSLTITDAKGCQATNTKPNISVFNTNFSVSVTNGCSPLNVEFTDLSTNAGNWLWLFGDGTTSSQQNPSHSYLNNGVFQVMLISKTVNGCVDTMEFNSINVNVLKANFISSNPTNCSPTLVSFNDLSIGATSWLWYFGDGSSSINQNPTHIYNIPGLYTLQLIVTSSNGCTDTLTRINYVNVPGTIANFSASSNQYCAQSLFQFTNSSINATSWNWNFGDGNTSTQQHPSHSYQNTGQYTISLIVHDSFGCASNFILPNPITVNPLPVSNFIVSDTVFCSPFSISFYNRSQNAITWLWNFGDGDTSTLQNPSHIYLNPGTYTVSLIATNEFGCSDTRMFYPIVANVMPVADFTSTAVEGCSPFTVSFSAASNLIPNANYFWNFGNDTTSAEQNPSTLFINPGFYTISLIISNKKGCSDTVIKPSFIEVYDFVPPAESGLLYVTVTANNSTSLLWNKSTASDFAYYKIYRKEYSTGNYLPIAIINNNLVVSFLDTNSNNLSTSNCYKVQTFDNCGYALPLDSLQEHCTINVSAGGVNDYIQINWTPYIGASADSYTLYRMEKGSATVVTVATVPSTVLSIIDTNLYCPIEFSYRIKANNLNGNIFCSSSDTSIAKPHYNVFAHQKVNVVRSTVINNNAILTEWETPIIAPEKVSGYKIYKSADNITFSLLTTVNSQVHEFIDNDPDVREKNYYYKIEAENLCNAQTMGSNKSSSILLKAELAEGNVLLNWTKYEDWSMGVDYYIIEKMDEKGEWEFFKKVDGNVLIYKVE